MAARAKRAKKRTAKRTAKKPATRKKGARRRRRPLAPQAPRGSGDAIVALGLAHEGESYELGARAPMSNARWSGPWDCAEFASWCLFQSSGLLFGVRPASDPVRADAYTGYWDEDAGADQRIGIEEAARIPGAMLLRAPRAARGGHIAISDGRGGTIEAHGRENGVSCQAVGGRRWDTGVLVPGLRYFLNEVATPVSTPTDLLRLTQPMMRGPRVLALQKRLRQLGHHPGAQDGVFGPQTQFAVIAFQRDQGLVADGEVGALTRAGLGLD